MLRDTAVAELAATTIGELSWPQILKSAQRFEQLGGGRVPHDATCIDDLAIAGPAEIRAVSRNMCVETGGAVMSSGGTLGRPKVTYVPYAQAHARLDHEWSPLQGDDILLNLFTPGRMWASHYYMQALAERSQCNVVPAGPFNKAELAEWSPLFADLDVTALAGNPTTLADFAEGTVAAATPLNIERIIWMAEPWTKSKLDSVTSAFPDAELWGNYGSVETWVIATNTPACDAGVLHLLADQLLESDPEGALLTRVGDGWTVPTVRYRLGDQVEAATCACGRDRALVVVGRADNAVKLHGNLVNFGDVLRTTAGVPGLVEAQLVVSPIEGDRNVISQLDVRYLGTAAEEAVLAAVVAQTIGLDSIAEEHPNVISASRVNSLSRVARTNKVAPIVWHQ